MVQLSCPVCTEFQRREGLSLPEPDCAEKVSNALLKMLRLGCGKELEVSLDPSNDPQFTSKDTVCKAGRIFFFILAILLFPLTLAGLAIAACSKSRQWMHKKLDEIEKKPPPPRTPLSTPPSSPQISPRQNVDHWKKLRKDEKKQQDPQLENSSNTLTKQQKELDDAAQNVVNDPDTFIQLADGNPLKAMDHLTFFIKAGNLRAIEACLTEKLAENLGRKNLLALKRTLLDFAIREAHPSIVDSLCKNVDIVDESAFSWLEGFLTVPSFQRDGYRKSLRDCAKILYRALPTNSPLRKTYHKYAV